MNIRQLATCTLAGLLVSAALLLGLAVGSAHRPAAATEGGTERRIELEIVRTYPDGLALAWSDPSATYGGGYELIGDVTDYDVISGTVTLPVLASFAPGSAAGSVRGLACGKVHRFWMISADGRDSNTIAGTTGPCQ